MFVAPDGTEWTDRIPRDPVDAWRNQLTDFHDGPRGIACVPQNAGIEKSDVFCMFFEEEVQAQICNWTNECGQSLVADWNSHHGPLDQKEWKLLTPIELRGFFGLLLLAGIERPKRKPWHEFWSKDTSVCSFSLFIALIHLC